MARRLIGSGTTDANGRISVSYSGKGAGKLQLVAVSGNLTSEVYDLYDCVAVDKGLSNDYNDIWITNADTTLTRGNEYSEIGEAGNNSALLRLNGSSSVSANGTIEFDFYQVDGLASNTPVFIRSKTGGSNVGNFNLNNINASVGAWIHIKIVFNGNTATVISPTLPEGHTITLSSVYDTYGLAFSTPGPITALRFKNFMVY